MNSAPSLVRHGQSPESLARAIFKAEVPEEVVRALPAQSVYLAIAATGVESAGTLISLLTREQYQICLDFELWNKDDFNEDKFWQWLAAVDESESLIPLRRLLEAVDLKLISLIISSHVQTTIFDEPTENPPGPLYFTPDNGYTWVFISLDDPERHRLLGKLLAYIFESSAELFYQLMSIQNVSTLTELEESAFQDKCRRLADEGIPESEFAFKVHSPLTLNEVKAELREARDNAALEYLPIVEPLIYSTENPDHVLSLIKSLSEGGHNKESEEFEGELSLILNAAIIRFGISFSELPEVTKLSAQVKGALNIGFALAQKETSLEIVELYKSFGLQKIYRLGIAPIMDLGRTAQRLTKDMLDDIVIDAALFAIVAGARCPFPEYPNFLNEDGSHNQTEGRLTPGYRPFSHIEQALLVKKILSSRFSN